MWRSRCWSDSKSRTMDTAWVLLLIKISIRCTGVKHHYITVTTQNRKKSQIKLQKDNHYFQYRCLQTAMPSTVDYWETRLLRLSFSPEFAHHDNDHKIAHYGWWWYSGRHPDSGRDSAKPPADRATLRRPLPPQCTNFEGKMKRYFRERFQFILK